MCPKIRLTDTVEIFLELNRAYVEISISVPKLDSSRPWFVLRPIMTSNACFGSHWLRPACFSVYILQKLAYASLASLGRTNQVLFFLFSISKFSYLNNSIRQGLFDPVLILLLFYFEIIYLLVIFDKDFWASLDL